MFSWILALLLALFTWSLAAAWLWLVKRRNTERRHGLAALAAMRWREFSQVVRRAMAEQRGMQDVVDEDSGDRGTSSDFLMERQGQRWLLSCKHGRAYRIGAAAIAELGTAQRLTGASGGILITEGLVERDGLAAAGKESIEVLDGRVLWQVLAPFMPEQTRNTVTDIARHEAVRQTGIAALAALTLGLLVGLGYQTARDEAVVASAVPAQPATPAGKPAAARSASAQPAAAAAGNPTAAGTAVAPAVAAPAPAQAAAAADAAKPAEQLLDDPDPATLLRYQQDVSRELARKPGVISGIWVTNSTLAIERSADDAKVWPLICAEVERYPALRTARIQLNPRPGVDEPVRWRQCHTF